jgi:hypothetical protein
MPGDGQSVPNSSDRDVVLISGVLTKADMVTDEERFQRWRSIIAGQDPHHRLFHGYFATMQKRPSSQATWQENLRNEAQFFRTDPIWAKLDWTVRCIGTLELRKKLSLELSKLIKERYIHRVQGTPLM